MTSKEKLQQEYEATPMKLVITNEGEFSRLQAMSADELLALDPQTRSKFFATAKYHANQRFAISLEGMEVGGKSVDEIVKLME